MILSEATNSEVITRFFTTKKSIKSANCHFVQTKTGWAFYNYSTQIAYIDDSHPDILILNSASYSNTTSKIQSELRSTASEYNMKVLEADEPFIDEVRDNGLSYNVVAGAEDLIVLKRQCIKFLFGRKKTDMLDFERLRDKIEVIMTLKP